MIQKRITICGSFHPFLQMMWIGAIRKMRFP